MLRVVALLRGIALLTLISTTLSASDKGVLKGIVKDIAEGTVVSGAYILVHRSGPGEAEDVRVRVGRDGTFSIGLAPGFYDVFVTAVGFAPTCRKVEVQPGQAAVSTRELGCLGLNRPTNRGGRTEDLSSLPRNDESKGLTFGAAEAAPFQIHEDGVFPQPLNS